MNRLTVQVQQNTADPHGTWENTLSKQRICRPHKLKTRLSGPVEPGYVRFVCISDTHGKLGELLPRIPAGDVLVHCGDFTNYGEADEIEKFDSEMGQLPHKHKIVIAGNHELGFEDDEDLVLRADQNVDRGLSRGYKLLKNCTYLHDSSVTVLGIKIYGSSWHPLSGYSFFRRRGQDILNHWNKIPEDVDVLLTHTPPLGHSDMHYEKHLGCAELLNTVEQRVKPKFHVFGHVHEQNGCTTNDETIFINASICTNAMIPKNHPVVFDMKI